MNTLYDTLLAMLTEHTQSAAIVFGTTIAIIVAMAIDFFSGWRKAVERGEATTSKAMRKTCDKALKYFTPYLVLVCLDFITCIIIPMPVFSMAWAVYCVSCEFLSVRESAWDKGKIKKQNEVIDAFISHFGNKEELLAAIGEIIKKAKEE